MLVVPLPDSEAEPRKAAALSGLPEGLFSPVPSRLAGSLGPGVWISAANLGGTPCQAALGIVDRHKVAPSSQVSLRGSTSLQPTPIRSATK